MATKTATKECSTAGNWAALLGRLLIAFTFILSGVTKSQGWIWRPYATTLCQKSVLPQPLIHGRRLLVHALDLMLGESDFGADEFRN